MKKLLLVVLFVAVLAGIVFFRARPDGSLTVATPLHQATSPTPQVTREETTSIFVPYWGLGGSDFTDEYDRYIYFGVTPGTSGVNTEDVGYASLSSFVENASGHESSLTLRMLDSKQNFAILDNTSRQQALIADMIRTAKANGFSGIVLDLEVSALPFDSLIKQISSFNKRFYAEAKKAELHYAVSLYGDTYFRIRPFDVKAIAGNADEVMIMAYDFHKARGNPGPNFPLGGKDTYGYDYSRLIEHFSKEVPKEKLTVIFGYFGYDWEVNNEKNMVTHGVPLSYNQVEERFITDCRFTACSQKRDTQSAESVVSYTDAEGASHLVWFEDAESVAKKREFLKEQGITSYSYWAYSYF